MHGRQQVTAQRGMGLKQAKKEFFQPSAPAGEVEWRVSPGFSRTLLNL
jgi:hypothetical protein